MKDLLVKVKIPPVDFQIVTQWAQEFNNDCVMRTDDTKIENGSLCIKAHDLSIFIEGSKYGSDTVLTIYRLKKSAIAALNASALRRKNVVAKRNLENALIFLKESSPQSSGYGEQMLNPRVLIKLLHV